MPYQDAYDIKTTVTDGSYDRCRGGVLDIKLTIPSETIDVIGGKVNGKPQPGKVTTKELKTTVQIDWEKLPLVNTAAYKIEESQTGPDTLPYPPDPIAFTFS